MTTDPKSATDTGRKMVLVPLDALDRIMRDCEHGSRIWKECDALLRQYRLEAAASPTESSHGQEGIPRTTALVKRLAKGEGEPWTVAEMELAENGHQLERKLADCRARLAKFNEERERQHTRADEAESRLASHAEREGAELQGHDEPCYYCGEPCNSLAGNPERWPVALCHRDNPGKVKWHHTSCVTDRLIENQPAPSAASGLAGWKVERLKRYSFECYSIKAPDGSVAVVSALDRNPSNVLFMLTKEVLRSHRAPVGEGSVTQTKPKD